MTEKKRLMDQMIADQEVHRETLQRVQSDFAEQQKRLMNVRFKDLILDAKNFLNKVQLIN